MRIGEFLDKFLSQLSISELSAVRHEYIARLHTTQGREQRTRSRGLHPGILNIACLPHHDFHLKKQNLINHRAGSLYKR